MKMITSKELEQNLRRINIEPDTKFQKTVIAQLLSISQNYVPKKRDNRISILNVFNFKYLFNMNAKSRLVVFLGIFSLLLIIGVSSIYASDGAAVGDLLFPLDKGFENVRRLFISDPKKEAEFELEVLGERIEEYNKLNMQYKSQDEIQAGFDECTKQRERVEARIRVMEESENVEEGEKEEVRNRYERYEDQMQGPNQNQNQEQNENQQDQTESSTEAIETASDDTTGEPGGVGVQQRPQDQDRDGSNEDSSGDGEQPRTGW